MSNEVEFIPPIFQDAFTLEEAIKLIYWEVTPKADATKVGTDDENIGIVSGVVTINHEPELVVKFDDGIRQYTKREFEKQLTVLDD